MNFKELGDNLYEKSPDSIERYLLNTIQLYLKDQGLQNNPTSREYIIEQAVKRMKEELGLIQGVKSVNGKTGVVEITIDEINAEPKILEKKSAFNVDFGNKKGTACEGNDPRLFDARLPISHKHEIVDVIGLEGAMTTLNASVQQLNQKAHTHERKDVLDKITYSGQSNSIDLTDIENKTIALNQMINEVESKNTIALSQMNEVLANTQEAVSNSKIIELETDARNNITAAKEELKNYVDSKINLTKADVQLKVDSLATKEMVESLVLKAEEIETFIGEQSLSLANILDSGNEYPLITSQLILEELERYGITDLKKCLIEMEVEDNEKKASGIYFISDPVPAGFISFYVMTDGVHVKYNKIDINHIATEEQRGIKITIKFYAKKKVIVND